MRIGDFTVDELHLLRFILAGKVLGWDDPGRVTRRDNLVRLGLIQYSVDDTYVATTRGRDVMETVKKLLFSPL